MWGYDMVGAFCTNCVSRSSVTFQAIATLNKKWDWEYYT
jgi:hypothetical protein